MEQWFSEGLQKWYKKNHRDLPWRKESDAYKIWLSEVILQQTQVAQGLSYYLSFTNRFPTVKHLARASEDEVMKLWQGLGYYSRARNMHTSARIIVEEHGGSFPANFEGIRNLKGIGDYTAAAIASFAFGLPHAVVDGNVYRVLSRVFGISTPIDSGAGKKEFAALATELLDKKRPALYNQAIMEFGSQFCRPVNPSCEICIFQSRCAAFLSGKVNELPRKSKKIKTRTRHFNYLVCVDTKKNVRVQKRGGGDIWQGLYEFPLFESENALTPEALLKETAVKKMLKGKYGIKYVSGTYKHVLTHQHLFARFYVLALQQPFAEDIEVCRLSKLQDRAFPRLIEKFLADCVLEEIF